MVRRHKTAATWVFGGLLLVLIVIAAEVGLRFSAQAGSGPAPSSIYAPDFSVGDPAPDFTLPDRHNKPHRLSDLVRRDTLLFFTCGCANCIDLQTYTGILVKRMGAAAPDLITVTTMPKEREESYYRDTQLKQHLLYEPKEGPVMALYRGHPCPRIYRLRGDRTVSWIGTSPGDTPFVQAIGNELAANLGFEPEREMRPEFPDSPPAPSLEH